MYGSLPARDGAEWQLRKNRNVDQTWVVPLHQHGVRVQAPQIVDDEALESADVLDFLKRYDVEVHRGNP
jgi:hypothetical protein